MFWNAVCQPLLCWFGHGLDGCDVVDICDLRQGVAVALLGAELLQLGAGGEDALPLRSELSAAVLMGLQRLVEGGAYFVVFLHELPHAVEHLVGEGIHLLVVLRLGYLRPCEVDDAQGGEEK